MHLERIVVFLPCHSLDDFPTWLDEREADGLLAAWTAAWHPALIAGVGCVPRWTSVEAPSADPAPLLGIVPPACDERFAAVVDMAGIVGSRFVRRAEGRASTVASALATLAESNGVASAEALLAADFHALGLARLLAELLARR
ncbi:hypothetical protein EBR56_09580, partial [bacterium]|nr:hypothetical protein [bacterium]